MERNVHLGKILSTRSFPKTPLNDIVYTKFRDADNVSAGTVENMRIGFLYLHDNTLSNGLKPSYKYQLIMSLVS